MKIHLQYSDGASNKFWAIDQEGAAFTVTYGRVGSTGQSKNKVFDSEERAISEAAKLVAAKKKKGYEQVDGAAEPVATQAEPTVKSAKGMDAGKRPSPKKAPGKNPAPEKAVESIAEAEHRGNDRTYEFQDGKAHKFWQVRLEEETLTTRYGAWNSAHYDSSGTTKAKSFNSAPEAREAMVKACKAKERAGYTLSNIFFSKGQRAAIAAAKKVGAKEITINSHVPEALLLACELTELERLTISTRRPAVLPAEIGNLKKLRYLNVQGCDLKELPDTIGNLTNLETLTAYNNELTALPESIGRCTQIKSLSIWSNKLASLPAGIGGLSSLIRLELQRNQLQTLPAEICGLAKLEELKIGSNPLVELPEEIGRLHSLQHLEISDTTLKNLPESLGQVEGLTSIIVDGYAQGALSELPASLTGHKTLATLHFKNCNFGRIPELLASLPNLESVDFSGNPLQKNILDVVDDKDALFKALGWGEAGAVGGQSDRLALPSEEDVARIVESERARLDAYRRDPGYQNEEAAERVLQYITGETNEIPLIKAKNATSCESIQGLLTPYEQWTFVQERTLAVLATRWRFPSSSYHNGFFRPFCSWLEELGVHDTPHLFGEVAERLYEYGLSKEEVITAVLDQGPKSLFVAGQATSVGRYIAQACKDVPSIVDWAYAEYASTPLVECLLREGEVAPFVERFAEMKHHAQTGNINALVNFDAAKYEPILLKALDEISMDCAPCVNDLSRALLNNYEKKHYKRGLVLTEQFLKVISEKQNKSGNSHARVSWMSTRLAMDIDQDIDWLLGALGKDAKEMVFNYVDHTKMLNLDVVVVAARHLGQDGISLIAQALNMPLRKGLGTHYQRVFQLLQHLDFSDYEDRVWEIAACELEDIQNSAARALSWRPKTSFGPACDLLDSSNKEERLTGTKVLAYLGSEQSLAVLAKRVDSEKNDDIRDIMVAAVYRSSVKVTKTEAIARIRSGKDRGKLNTWGKRWLDESTLPGLAWREGKADSDLARFLVYRQLRHDQYEMDPEARDVVPLLDSGSAAVFADALYAGILRNGGVAAKNRGLLSLVGAMCDDDLVPRLEALGVERNENAIRMLGMGTSEGKARALDRIRRRYQVKYPNIRTAAEEGFVGVADRMGVSVYALRDKLVPDLGFSQCSRSLTIGTSVYKVTLSSEFKLQFVDANGKATKSVPKAADPTTKKDFAGLAKEVAALKREYRPIVSDWLVTGRRWSSEEWAELFMGNAFMNATAQGLVWGLFHNDALVVNFTMNADKTMETLDGGRVSILGPHWVTDFQTMLGIKQSKPFKDRKKEIAIHIALAHPIALEVNERDAWAALFAARKIAPAISQLNRPVIRPTEKEGGAKASYRFENQRVGAGAFKARATDQGWRRGSVNDAGSVSAYYKRFDDYGVDVFLTMEGLSVVSSDEDVQMQQLLFVESGSILTGAYTYDEPRDESDERLILLAEVPSIVFSEAVANVESIVRA